MSSERGEKDVEVELRDAATVLLLRERAAGFEVFMVRRSGGSRFMGGAHVFPGGKLDDADRHYDGRRRLPDAPLSTELSEPELAPERALGLYVAALRETFEEAGVLLADPLGDEAFRLYARAQLQRGEGALAELAARAGWTLRLDALVPQARWITPRAQPRRYDTRFFLARAPEDQRAAADELETFAGEWFTPARALAAAEGGEIVLPPPTLRTLLHLATFETVQACFADARTRRPPRIEPVHHVDEAGEHVIAFNGDPAHPIRERAFPGPTRVVRRGSIWRAE